MINQGACGRLSKDRRVKSEQNFERATGLGKREAQKRWPSEFYSRVQKLTPSNLITQRSIERKRRSRGIRGEHTLPLKLHTHQMDCGRLITSRLLALKQSRRSPTMPPSRGLKGDEDEEERRGWGAATVHRKIGGWGVGLS
jgi:hypothetical protein